MDDHRDHRRAVDGVRQPRPRSRGGRDRDFGIAKDLEGNLDAARPRTVSGSIYGTAAYVAPELLSGKPPDARVDIYALGVVLYELLSGDKPFAGDALSDILIGHLQTPPTPLHVKCPGRVPGAVDELVLRALAKRPDDRFQSVTELAEAIAATLDPLAMQRAVEAGAIPTGPYLAVRREHSNPALDRPALAASRRSRGPAGPALVTQRRLTAAVAVILVAALALLAWTRRPQPAEPVAAPASPAPAALREPAPASPRAPQSLAPPAPPVAAPASPRAPQSLAPPAPPVAAPLDPAPVAVRPTRLTPAAVRKEIQRRIAPRAQACLARHTKLIKGQQFPMRVEILPSGEARATATLANSPAARCIADLFQRHRFPANLGGLTVDHSFTP